MTSPDRTYPARKPTLPKAEYDRLYNNGWRAALSNADMPDSKPAAWFDGFYDQATGREKWHRRDCTASNHDGCP